MRTHYICDTCGFTFVRSEEQSACPDCGKPSVREASESEIANYERNRAELDSEYDA